MQIHRHLSVAFAIVDCQSPLFSSTKSPEMSLHEPWETFCFKVGEPRFLDMPITSTSEAGVGWASCDLNGVECSSFTIATLPSHENYPEENSLSITALDRQTDLGQCPSEHRPRKTRMGANVEFLTAIAFSRDQWVSRPRMLSVQSLKVTLYRNVPRSFWPMIAFLLFAVVLNYFGVVFVSYRTRPYSSGGRTCLLSLRLRQHAILLAMALCCSLTDIILTTLFDNTLTTLAFTFLCDFLIVSLALRILSYKSLRGIQEPAMKHQQRAILLNSCSSRLTLYPFYCLRLAGVHHLCKVFKIWVSKRILLLKVITGIIRQKAFRFIFGRDEEDSDAVMEGRTRIHWSCVSPECHRH